MAGPDLILTPEGLLSRAEYESFKSKHCPVATNEGEAKPDRKKRHVPGCSSCGARRRIVKGVGLCKRCVKHRKNKNKRAKKRMIESLSLITGIVENDFDVTGYNSRNAILKNLGFESYADYLVSGLWCKIRDAVFRQKGQVCVGCGSNAIQQHHRRYKEADLTGKCLDFIVPICAMCHTWIEFSDGRKVSAECAELRLKVLIDRNRNAS